MPLTPPSSLAASPAAHPAGPPGACSPGARGEAPAAGAPADTSDRAAGAVLALARVSRLLERASGELGLAHYRVLAAIASGDQRASRIASRLALGKPTVSATVEALCQRGLLTRLEVAGDQRATALSLTEAGAAALASAQEQMVSALGRLCARTPDPPRVLEALSHLGAAMDAALSERPSEPAAGRR